MITLQQLVQQNNGSPSGNEEDRKDTFAAETDVFIDQFFSDQKEP